MEAEKGNLISVLGRRIEKGSGVSKFFVELIRTLGLERGRSGARGEKYTQLSSAARCNGSLPALGKMRQKIAMNLVPAWAHSEFQASLSCSMRPSLPCKTALVKV